MIVRDEEKFLEGCLASIVDAVEEIVIVDTGSKDRSIEIAKSYGARVIEKEWRNDFAWARNVGLEAARGDWILYIDADERLSLPDGAKLSDNLDGENVFAGKVRFTAHSSLTPYREYRLFRNDPRLRFKSAMHETFLIDFQVLRDTIGAIAADSPAEITHLGFEGDQMHKHRRNLPLLRKAIADNPDRSYFWLHLSLTLAGIDEMDEALEIAREGVARARKSIDADGRHPPSASALARFAARHLYLRGEDPMPMIEAGLELYPDNIALQALQARIFEDEGRHEEALALLEPICALDPKTFCDPAMGYNRHLLEVEVHDLMGVVLAKLGRRDEAADAFARAAEGDPDDMSFRVKAMALRSQAPAAT